MSYHSESDNMMSESVEQFKELARQIEGEEHGRGDEREPDSEREYRRSNFERERKLDSTHSSRYQPYSTSRPDRESRSSKKEHRVYVYNLPFSLKWQDLKDHMKKAGDVVFAEIMEDSTGKSKGCGIVEFTSTEDAQRAIRELNDSDLRGRLMKIREDQQDRDDRPRRPRDRDRSSRDRDHSSSGSLGSVAGLSMLGLGQFGLLQQMSSKSDTASCSVFVSNLDYRVTWAKLKDTFKAAGRVVRADVAEDHDKKSKGHGTVQFETPLEAINAVFIMNGKSIYDRSMNVRLDRESPYFSMFGGNDGGKTSSTLAATASLQSMPNLNSLTSLAGLSGMGGMGGLGGGVSPLALLQLQSLQSQMSGLGGMASLNNMAGLSGFGGLGTTAMNLGTGATAGSFQSSQGLSAADTSSLGGYSNTSALNTANGSGLGASAMSNPYALWMQQLYGMQGMQGYGGTQASYGTATETQPQVKGDPAKQVFVRNLPWKVTWQDLKDKFREAGRVVRADVLMDDSKRSKGCGTVLFESAEEASRAVLSFNGTVMDGREIEVRMDRG